MSILIKGMEMPKQGETITVTICDDGLVFEEYYKGVFNAVPVPPHGRLIDADGEIGVNVMMMPGMKCKVDLTAPTIIPAEEEET